MQTISATVGYVAANDQAVAASQSVAAASTLTLTASPVTLAYPSQIVITTSANYTSVNFTIVGTDANGVAVTETVTGPNTTTKNLTNYFKTVSSVTTDGGVGGGAVKVGTTGVTSSRWMYLDSWTTGYTSVQCVASGTVNYTVQVTLDNPADPHVTVAVPNVTWTNSNDAAVVNATTTQQSNFAFTPSYVRVLQNSGSGSVTTTLLQTGVVNR